MVVEDSGGGCPDAPCDDTDLYPDTAGLQHLDQIVITGPGRKGSGNGTSEMPDWLKHGLNEPVTWESTYKGANMEEYNEEYGTDYEYGTAYSHYYYDVYYKPEYDAMISDMEAARRPFVWGVLAAGTAPFAIGVGATYGVPLIYNGATSGYGWAQSGYFAAQHYTTSAYLWLNTGAGITASSSSTLIYNSLYRKNYLYFPNFTYMNNIDYVGSSWQFYKAYSFLINGYLFTK